MANQISLQTSIEVSSGTPESRRMEILVGTTSALVGLAILATGVGAAVVGAFLLLIGLAMLTNRAYEHLLEKHSWTQENGVPRLANDSKKATVGGQAVSTQYFRDAMVYHEDMRILGHAVPPCSETNWETALPWQENLIEQLKQAVNGNSDTVLELTKVFNQALPIYLQQKIKEALTTPSWEPVVNLNSAQVFLSLDSTHPLIVSVELRGTVETWQPVSGRGETIQAKRPFFARAEVDLAEKTTRFTVIPGRFGTLVGLFRSLRKNLH